MHVVAVLLGVVGGQQHPGRSGEVEEAGDCRSKKEKKVQSFPLLRKTRNSKVFYDLARLFLCISAHKGQKKQHCISPGTEQVGQMKNV